MASTSNILDDTKERSDDDSTTITSESENEALVTNSTTPNKSAKNNIETLSVDSKTKEEDAHIDTEDKKKVKKGRKLKSKKRHRIRKQDSSLERTISVDNSSPRSLLAAEGKKLRKRRSVSKLFIDPNGAIEKKLEHKYIELEQLINRQFVERKTNITHLHIGQMEVLRQQYNLSCHGLPPTGSTMYSSGRRRPQSAHAAWNSESDDAYGAIRQIQQMSKHRRPRSHSRSKSAKSRREIVSDSEAHRQVIDINLETASLSSARSPRTRKKRIYDSSTDQGSRQSANSRSSESLSISPTRGYIPTDNQLKSTDNKQIKEWLKKKNIELRKQRAVERTERKDKRKESILRENEKIMAIEAGRSKVDEWMRQKRREAIEEKKLEKARKKRLEQEKTERDDMKKMESVQGKSWNRPASAPAARSNRKLLSSSEDASTSNDTTVPHPPSSKLMYKRSSAGRVRLRVKSKERQPETSDPSSLEKSVEASQLSYSEWLEKKRLQDKEKKKTEAEAKAQAKTESEQDTILPELHKNRVSRVLKSKKRVDSGLKQSEDESGDPESSVETFLSVNGAKASISSRNSYVRPQSALAKPPSPQPCKSPKRPRSAHPRVDAILDEEDQEADAGDNPFQLPFPAHLGVPKEVEKTQTKVFPHRVAAERHSMEEQRQSPQGSDLLPGDGQQTMTTTEVTEKVSDALKQQQEEGEVGASFFDKDEEIEQEPECSSNNTEADKVSEEGNQSFLDQSQEKHEPDKFNKELNQNGNNKNIYNDFSEDVTLAEVTTGIEVNITELPSEKIPTLGEEGAERDQHLPQNYEIQIDDLGQFADEDTFEEPTDEDVPNHVSVSEQNSTQDVLQDMVTDTYMPNDSSKSEEIDSSTENNGVANTEEVSSKEQVLSDGNKSKNEQDKSLLEQLVESLPDTDEDDNGETSSLDAKQNSESEDITNRTDAAEQSFVENLNNTEQVQQKHEDVKENFEHESQANSSLDTKQNSESEDITNRTDAAEQSFVENPNNTEQVEQIHEDVKEIFEHESQANSILEISTGEQNIDTPDDMHVDELYGSSDVYQHEVYGHNADNEINTYTSIEHGAYSDQVIVRAEQVKETVNAILINTVTESQDNQELHQGVVNTSIADGAMFDIGQSNSQEILANVSTEEKLCAISDPIKDSADNTPQSILSEDLTPSEKSNVTDSETEITQVESGSKTDLILINDQKQIKQSVLGEIEQHETKQTQFIDYMKPHKLIKLSENENQAQQSDTSNYETPNNEALTGSEVPVPNYEISTETQDTVPETTQTYSEQTYGLTNEEIGEEIEEEVNEHQDGSEIMTEQNVDTDIQAVQITDSVYTGVQVDDQDKCLGEELNRQSPESETEEYTHFTKPTQNLVETAELHSYVQNVITGASAIVSNLNGSFQQAEEPVETFQAKPDEDQEICSSIIEDPDDSSTNSLSELNYQPVQTITNAPDTIYQVQTTDHDDYAKSNLPENKSEDSNNSIQQSPMEANEQTQEQIISEPEPVIKQELSEDEMLEQLQKRLQRLRSNEDMVADNDLDTASGNSSDSTLENVNSESSNSEERISSPDQSNSTLPEVNGIEQSQEKQPETYLNVTLEIKDVASQNAQESAPSPTYEDKNAVTESDTQSSSDDLNNNKIDLPNDNDKFFTEPDTVVETHTTSITSESEEDPSVNNSQTLQNLNNEINQSADEWNDSLTDSPTDSSTDVNENIKSVASQGILKDTNSDESTQSPRKRVSFTRPVIIQNGAGGSSQQINENESDSADDLLRTMI